MLSWRKELAARLRNIQFTEADLHGYQETAVDFSMVRKFCALFIDTGLGKTIIILTLISRLFMRNDFHKVLIIGPVRVISQTWPNQIVEWEHTAWLQFTVVRVEDDDPEVLQAGRDAVERFRAANSKSTLQGLRKARQDAVFFATTREEVREATKDILSVEKVRAAAETKKKDEMRRALLAEKTPIHLINREAIPWLVEQYSVWEKVKGAKKLRRKIVNWPYDFVVIDELSSFKDYAADRFRALAAVRKQGFIKRLIGLTASPASESYMGLFAEMFLIDLGKRLGTAITHYRNMYWDQSPWSRFTFKLREGAKESIAKKIADICLVMKAKDYLDEEDPDFLVRPIKMTDQQLADYKRFQRDFVLEVGDNELVEAKTAGDLAGKLLQVSSGAIYGKDKKVHLIHNHKIEDLQQLAEEIETPLLIGYWYKSSLARLKAAFPEGVQVDKAGKLADGRKSPWCRGKIRYMWIHPQSGGHGLNMQYGPGHDLYMFDLTWSWEMFYQLYRRLARQGQATKVRIHLPVMKGTLEEGVVQRLKAKEDAENWLFERIRAIQRRLKERKASGL